MHLFPKHVLVCQVVYAISQIIEPGSLRSKGIWRMIRADMPTAHKILIFL